MYCKLYKIFIISLLLLFGVKANAQSNVRQAFVKAIDSTHIIDFERLFTPAQAAKLNETISDFEREKHISICIVTLDTSQVERLNFDDYTLNLAQAWNYDKTD